nr:hypothetical protein [Tanacetum cinerariifolium]
MLRACPHHGFTELTQIDTFYNGLNENDQDSLNAAAGGNLFSKTTREALQIIENKSQVRYSRNKPNFSRMNTTSRENVSKSDDRIDKLADQISTLVDIFAKKVVTPAMVKAVEESCVRCGGNHAYYNYDATISNQSSVCAKTGTYNQVAPQNRASNYMAPPGFAPVQNNGQNRFNQNQGQGNNFNRGNNFHGNQSFQVPNNQVQQGFSNEFLSYKKANDQMMRNMQSQINSLKGEFKNEIQTTMKTQQTGTLPSNPILNPKGEIKAITTRSGVAYEGPLIPTKHSPKKVVERETEETTDKEQTNFQGSTAHIQPSVAPILPDVPKTLPNFADALLLMPKFASTIKSLLENKDKFFELEKISLNENCSAMLLKKLPEKLGYPSKFLIPCDFPGMDVCHALADLGASINLMPLSIWKKLSLPELTPTSMTLELADRSITHPKGVAEDVFVKVGKFHFPTNFVVVDFEADPRVPLILGRSFLRTGRTLIDVYGEEITLRVNDEAVTFNLNQTTRYSSNMMKCRMPFGHYNAPGTFQRCMMAIFHDMIEKTMEVFMDDFLVDRAKVDVIAKLPHPTTVKGVRSFLGHAGFYRRFIQDFSKIARPMTHLLEKETPFVFYKDCIDAFDTLKKKLTEASILVVPDWNLPFEHIKTMTEAQIHYTMMEKEMLAVVYAFEKFRPYLVLSKSIVYTDHSALKYLLSKQDAKLRLLRWVLLLQEFDIIIRDKKGMKNLAADHLSRLENPHKDVFEIKDINENFPLETLGKISSERLKNHQLDARVVVKFLKSLFARFGTPRAIISDRGTHFCNDKFVKVMSMYGVTHRLATAYHLKTSGQVEVSNRGLKRILERTVKENRVSWSEKLEDALWAFRTAYKTPIGCTPYKLVYRKSCHLPIELEHKAYWALKHVNFDLKTAGNHRKLQLNELNKLRYQAYENSLIYKEKTKKLHDSKIKNRIFNVGDRVLFFNFHLKIFSGKLKTRWSGPFTITRVFPYGTVELSQP